MNNEAKINPHILFLVKYQKQKQSKQTKTKQNTKKTKQTNKTIKPILGHLHVYERMKKIGYYPEEPMRGGVVLRFIK